MKTTITSLILLAAIVLPLHADSPVPASSSIEIKMTRTVEIAEKPTKEELQAEKATRNHHFNSNYNTKK